MSQSKRISFKKPVSLSKHDLKSDLSNNNTWTSVNDLRTSKSMESTGVLEAEYIKSLQQQIYLLELENNHLRQQTIKATEMQPKMTTEAQLMLENLKNLQKKVESLELELFRKEGHVDLLNTKIQQLTKKLDHEADKHGREKTMIMGDSLNNRKDLENLERELTRKNLLLEEIKDDLQRNSSNLQSAENKVELLRAQLQDEMAKTRAAEIELADKRTELLSVDNKLRELENRYVSTNNNYHDGIKKELKEEIMYLQNKLDEAKTTVEKEQNLRSKMSEDASRLLKENSVLNRQIIELQNSIERERSLREKFDHRRLQDSGEYEKLRQKEKEVDMKLRKMQMELDEEKARTTRLMAEMSQQEKVYNSRILEDSMNRKRVAETDSLNSNALHDNERLRQDKENLIEHIDNLQDELKNKDRNIKENNRLMQEMEMRLQQLESLKSLDDNIQYKRWDELEHTIDTLKDQAHKMASISKPRHQQRPNPTSSSANRSPVHKGSAALGRYTESPSPIYG